MEIYSSLFIINTVIITIVYYPRTTHAHGRLIDPPSRASMWRHGFNLPQNDYDDNQGYCGGQQQLWNRFEGVCGVCGDARYPIPRAHERGGRYYAGTKVKNYREGDTIEVTTQITANHRGWYEFRLCAYDDPRSEDLEYDSAGNFVEISHTCLDKHLLAVEGGGTRWYLPEPFKVGVYTVKVQLPHSLSCNNCLLQWKWNVANSWGRDSRGKSCIGCGDQEQFYACSDISIIPRSGQKPISTWRPPGRHPGRPKHEERPHYVTPPPRPPTQRPRPPDIPRPHPHPPQPQPHLDGDMAFPNRPIDFPYFTYSPIYTRPKLPPVPSGRTPIPPHYTPIVPHFPDWIPTHKPSWPWFTFEPQTLKQDKPTTSATRLPIFTQKSESTEMTAKSTPKFKFWNWLSDRFISNDLTTKTPITTTDPPETPWWVNLPSDNKVSKWWNFISKISLKRKGTTTAVPLPWWANKSKQSEEILLEVLTDEVEGEKSLNGISAAASKDRPEVEAGQQQQQTVGPVIVAKIRKRICTPVGSLIQQADMWVWCDVNCSNNEYCPKTHCICTSD